MPRPQIMTENKIAGITSIEKCTKWVSTLDSESDSTGVDAGACQTWIDIEINTSRFTKLQFYMECPQIKVMYFWRLNTQVKPNYCRSQLGRVV